MTKEEIVEELMNMPGGYQHLADAVAALDVRTPDESGLADLDDDTINELNAEVRKQRAGDDGELMLRRILGVVSDAVTARHYLEQAAGAARAYELLKQRRR